MYLPSPAFGAAILIRSVVLWTGIRAATVGLGIPPTIGAHSVLVLALVLVLSDHERGLLNERVLFGNLGVAQATLRLFGVVPAVCCEIVLHAATA